VEVPPVVDWGCGAGAGRGSEDIFVEADGRSSRRRHEMTEFARVEEKKGLVSGERMLFV